MAKANRTKGTNVVVYILIGLLVAGLAGFGIGGFSTSVRAIGSVGDEEISVDEYVRALQAEIDGFTRLTGTNISASQAVEIGLDRQALEGLYLQAALNNEAARLGLSVGDSTVLEQLSLMAAFQGIDGEFDQDSYEFALERAGLSPAEFDEILREGEAREIVRSSIVGGISPSRTYLDDLVEFSLNTRSFTWAAIGEEDLPDPVPDWTDSDLRTYYEDNPDEFTDPEMRAVTYAWLAPDMLSPNLDVDEDTIRAEYAARSDIYNLPERRVVDRLVFPDAEAARLAKERLDSKEIGFVEMLLERRIALADVELGEVDRSDLTEDAAALLFGSSETGIFGPVESQLGPAIFRVNAVLTGRVTPFEEAREELARDLAIESARDEIADRVDSYEDLLASGATLEELVADTELRFSSMSYGPETRDGIARHPEFRAAVEALSEGDFPELANLSDGGVFAVRLNDIIPPALRPFNAARDEVAAAWREQKVAELVRAHAESIRADLASGSTFEELALTATYAEDIGRSEYYLDGPSGLVAAAFELGVDDVSVFGEGVEVGIVRLNSINQVGMDDEIAMSLRDALSGQVSAATGQDVFRLYSEYLQKSAGIEIDHATITSIHAQLQ